MATNESIVAKPLAYDGSLSTYATWRRSLTLYMATNATKFPDDTAKIACALSYMTEGTANTWAQAFFEEKSTTGTFAPGTFTAFVDQLNATFRDVNRQAKAAKNLLENKFDINKTGPEGFFADYEILAREADIITGTATHDSIHVSNLKRILPFELRDRINQADPVPTTYAGYKQHCLRCYPAYKEREDRFVSFRNARNARRPQIQNQRAVMPYTPNTNRSSGPYPGTNRFPTSANRFRSPRPREAITPQERDRRQREDRCYWCGQKGHFAPNCPLGRNQDVKPKICTAVADMSPKERVELEAQLEQVEDSTITEDFQDTQQ